MSILSLWSSAILQHMLHIFQPTLTLSHGHYNGQLVSLQMDPMSKFTKMKKLFARGQLHCCLPIPVWRTGVEHWITTLTLSDF